MAGASSLTHGQSTGDGAAKQITSTAVGSSLVIKAFATNAATVYIGGSSVDATNGMPLEAGNAIGVDTINPNEFYFNVASPNKIAFIVIGP